MAYDLQEQEELDNFRRFWNVIGKWLFLFIILAGLGYLANVLWQNHKAKQNEAAALLLESFVPKAQAKDTAAANADLQKMQQQYPEAVATAQATFMSAGQSFDEGKYDVAERQLKWLKEHNNTPLVQMLSIQRLATVKLQQKDYEGALNMLNVNLPDALMPAILDMRGDVYAAKGDAAAARTAYQAVLDKLGKDDPQRAFIEAKKKALG